MLRLNRNLRVWMWWQPCNKCVFVSQSHLPAMKLEGGMVTVLKCPVLIKGLMANACHLTLPQHMAKCSRSEAEGSNWLLFHPRLFTCLLGIDSVACMSPEKVCSCQTLWLTKEHCVSITRNLCIVSCARQGREWVCLVGIQPLPRGNLELPTLQSAFEVAGGCVQQQNPDNKVLLACITRWMEGWMDEPALYLPAAVSALLPDGNTRSSKYPLNDLGKELMYPALTDLIST